MRTCRDLLLNTYVRYIARQCGRLYRSRVLLCDRRRRFCTVRRILRGTLWQWRNVIEKPIEEAHNVIAQCGPRHRYSFGGSATSCGKVVYSCVLATWRNRASAGFMMKSFASCHAGFLTISTATGARVAAFSATVSAMTPGGASVVCTPAVPGSTVRCAVGMGALSISRASASGLTLPDAVKGGTGSPRRNRRKSAKNCFHIIV